MATLSDRDKRIVEIARKGGNDAALFLLDLINELEDKVAANKIPDLVEMLKNIKGVKGDPGEDGKDGKTPEDSQILALIKPLIPTAKDGKDGKNPTKEELLALIKPLIQKGKDGETPSDEHLLELINSVMPPVPTLGEIIAKLEEIMPGLGDIFRNALELLKGDDRLDASAIKNLDEFVVEKIGASGGKTTYVPSGGASGGGIIRLYDVSPQLNGVLKTFSLPAFWRVVGVISSSSPSGFRPDVDYTTDANAYTIAFTSQIDAGSTLAAGQTLLVQYAEN